MHTWACRRSIFGVLLGSDSQTAAVHRMSQWLVLSLSFLFLAVWFEQRMPASLDTARWKRGLERSSRFRKWFFIQESGKHDVFNSCRLQPNKGIWNLRLLRHPQPWKTSQIEHLHSVGFTSSCNNIWWSFSTWFVVITSTTFILISLFKFLLCEVVVGYGGGVWKKVAFLNLPKCNFRFLHKCYMLHIRSSPPFFFRGGPNVILHLAGIKNQRRKQKTYIFEVFGPGQCS